MLIVAHRGGSPDQIENSADAFLRGIEIGADLLECDLQLSASGDIVIYHDTEFFGTPVAEFTTDELRAMWPKLLTFDEFLELLDSAGSDIRLVLDLKRRDVDRSLAVYLEDPALQARSLVTSTFSLSLWRLRRRFPDLRLGLSRGATFTRIPLRLRPLASASVGRIMTVLALIQMTMFRIDTAALQHDLVDRRTLGMFRKRGCRVYAWTVDSPARTRELHACGTDYLTTNVPAEMVPIVRAKRQEPGGSIP